MPTLQSLHFLADHQAGVLLVRDTRRVAPVLIGVPFLLAGLVAWALSLVVVWSHVAAGTIGAPGGYVPIVGMLLAGSLPFLWAGVRLSLHNRGVRLLPAEAAVDVVTDYVAVQRVERRRLSDFDAVVLRKDVRVARTSEADTAMTTAGTHVSVVIDLRAAAAGAAPQRVAFDYDAAAIRPLARLVAQVSGLPLVDELASGDA